MSVIIFIIILAILVLVHEFGHFIVAKKSGIRVDEFGLGFPPRIWGKKYDGTIYSINWIPFGGFVKIFGENPDDESLSGPQSSRSFVNKKRPIQALVLVAGVTMNILFAWVLISIGFMSGLPTSVDETNQSQIKDAKLVVTQVLSDSPAQKVGLKAGDEIVSLHSGADTLSDGAVDVSRVQNFISLHGGKSVSLELQRGGNAVEIEAIPTEGIVPGKSALGFSMDFIGSLRLPIHEALWEGAKLTANLTYAIAESLTLFIYHAFTGTADFSEVTGPVGIAGMVGDATQLGFIYLLSFTAFISLNLAVLNLLPFPALDGGRLLFVLIESVIRKPINHKVANALNSAGFALLILLMLVVTYKDIIKLIH
ncbi:MAG: RIP metalloprotease RseP [Candidatus Taylorbacteria bacterium]